MFILGQAPKRVGVQQIYHAIEAGRKNRKLMNLTDPYSKYKTDAECKSAMQRDAEYIANAYNEKVKELSYDKRMEFFKEIIHIQTGYDPLPKVGDFYRDHTVTDIVRTDKTFELYGVLGKMSKREIKGIIEEANKPECLRDKMKRRGYRFAVVEVF